MKKQIFISATAIMMMSACSSVKQTNTVSADMTINGTSSKTAVTTATTSAAQLSTPAVNTTSATIPITTTIVTTSATTAAATLPVTITPAATTVTTIPVTTTAITTTAITTTEVPLQPTIPSELSALADEIFRLTNVQRVNAGLPELGRFTLLDNIAQCRAEECAANKTISHTRPDGREFKTVLEDFGLKSKCSWWSENTAYCSAEPTADFAVNQWMASQGHKDNILRDVHTHVGIGVSIADNGSYYYVQDFIQLKK